MRDDDVGARMSTSEYVQRMGLFNGILSHQSSSLERQASAPEKEHRFVCSRPVCVSAFVFPPIKRSASMKRRELAPRLHCVRVGSSDLLTCGLCIGSDARRSMPRRAMSVH